MTEAVERDNPTGQIWLGPATKKLTPQEAGFRVHGGIPGLSCGDCRFYVNHDCWQVDVRPEPEDYCDEFQPSLQAGRIPSSTGATLNIMSLVSSDLYITRVATDKAGVKRWYATSSGIKRDAYGEYMTVELFQDFVRRIKEGEPAPDLFASDAWKGGNPYLGVAHYLDLDGYGIVGDTDDVYIDGTVLKARGTFRDTPLANRAYDAIRRDIDEGVPPDERVRISIAFVDYQHDHKGIGTFVRKSLAERCNYCADGKGEKYYQRGHLVHLALTRRPAYADTEIGLEERSMATKRDDAASIVGNDMADELENKAKEGLTARSDVDPAAIVVKQDAMEPGMGLGQGPLAGRPGGPPEAPMSGRKTVEQHMGEPNMHMTGTVHAKPPVIPEPAETGGQGAYRSYLGGAMNLNEAEAFLTRSGEPVLLGDWGVLTAILANVAMNPDMADKPTVIKSIIHDFRQGIDRVNLEALRKLSEFFGDKAGAGGEDVTKPNGEVQRTEQPPEPTPEPAPEPTPPAIIKRTPLDEAFGQLREQFDAVNAMAGDREAKLAAMQPSFDQLGDVVMREIYRTSPAPEAPHATQAAAPVGVSEERTVQIVAEQLAPIKAMLERALTAPGRSREVIRSVEVPFAPSPRALRPGQLVPGAGTVAPSGGGLRSLIRRSVGISTD